MAKSTPLELEEAERLDRRQVVQITDIIAAGRIFRALDPKCCPRCDALVTEARRRKEEDTNACAMCGETMHADDDGEAALAAAKETVARSKLAVETHRALCREAERKATGASEEIARCEAAVTALEGLLSGNCSFVAVMARAQSGAMPLSLSSPIAC